MDVLVIYESMYGNTHQVAEAIGDGLGAVGDVLVASVHDVEAHALEGCALLVVGGPTHVHGMSRPSSRTAAVAAAADDDDLVIEPDAAGPGLREFFGELRRGLTGQAAAFDTRVDKSVMLTGSAAKGIAKQLRKHGFDLAADPESFFVEDSDGPLASGELERARAWGATLARMVERAPEGSG
ncbi:MAG: flavodoxin family protein [Acidimicrobiales bacterium]|nr:flavodoxin family protein [Acidimicrobiales bacterium]